MATESFGTDITPALTSQDVINSLYKLLGFEFPVSVTVQDSKVVAFSFDTEWKVGATIPVDTVDVDGNITTDYQEDYKSFKMSDDQIAKLKQWATANVTT